MGNMVCIYCLQDKPPDGFKKREHVLPQCFGTFTPSNLILNEVVCDECNQYFGDHVELFLGRDTIEGIERYKHGIKPGKQPKHKRLKFKIAEGELTGIIITPKYSGGGEIIDIEPVMQAGIYNITTNRFDYYEPGDIPTAETLKKSVQDLKNLRFDFITKDDAELQKLLTILEEKGYKKVKLEAFREWPEHVKKRNETLVAGEIRLDRVIYRGLCKIAFNYLAFVQGKAFVLSDDFNGIRDFIRNDCGDSHDFFFVNQPPILENDRRLGIRETRGHLVVLEWNGMSLQVKLSLFNLNTYLIRLCNRYGGLWVPIKSGHHFDIESRTVTPLLAVNKKLLPYWQQKN